jgi:Tol biopolymer transport system component
MYVQGTGLMAQRLDIDRGELEGEASLLASNVAPGALMMPARFAASDTGLLAFVETRGGRRARLRWFERSGRAGAELPEVRDAEFLNPAISPNGDRVAVNRMDPQTGNWDIWTVDVVRGLSSRVTISSAQDADPIWSPDGKALVFAAKQARGLALYRKTLDSEQPEEELLRFDGARLLIPSDWSRDGSVLIYSAAFAGGGPTTIWALPLTTDRKPVRVPGLGVPAYGGRISPDGQWIAFSSFETGSNEIYVQRFMASGPRAQVSSGGGAHPRWSADGRELIYWATPRGLASVALTLSATGIRAGVARSLSVDNIPNLVDGRTHYDLAPDGRLLVRQPVDTTPATITVFNNWRARLKP